MSGSASPSAASEDVDGIDAVSLFALLGRAHTLELRHEVVVAGEPPFRFNELQAGLETSPNTLSRRLDELVQAGFLTWRSYDEIQPRVEYEPTGELEALEPTFEELSAWMDRHGADGSGCPGR